MKIRQETRRNRKFGCCDAGCVSDGSHVGYVQTSHQENYNEKLKKECSNDKERS